MPVKKVLHPDAAHLEWAYSKDERVHRCYAGEQLVGTVTLSPANVKPTTYGWAIEGRGESGAYTTLRNAKRKVELKVFEQAVARSEARRKEKHGG